MQPETGTDLDVMEKDLVRRRHNALKSKEQAAARKAARKED